MCRIFLIVGKIRQHKKWRPRKIRREKKNEATEQVDLFSSDPQLNKWTTKKEKNETTQQVNN